MKKLILVLALSVSTIFTAQAFAAENTNPTPEEVIGGLVVLGQAQTLLNKPQLSNMFTRLFSGQDDKVWTNGLYDCSAAMQGENICQITVYEKNGLVSNVDITVHIKFGAVTMASLNE
jgi:hypothetical protein